jgi:hypothetical protein
MLQPLDVIYFSPLAGHYVGNGGIVIHGGQNEAEGCSIEEALASGYTYKYAK